ncbi:hypothetical protein PQQ52_24790 [Paraburkholderia sediminicola]|uniref:hypothetical protein n=1 Tax=Paraburkholderia sediminicola TaxID=458836 RepID=UPI0038B97DF2
MPAIGQHRCQPRDAAAHLAAGQVAIQDLRARTSIVAVEGHLQLDFRDHSLAWLGDAVPVTSITLHEGERYVTPQRGIIWIRAAHANSAVFVIQPWRAENERHSFIRQAVQHLADLVKTRLRRAA